MGSVVLPHLVSGWHVDQAIMSEEERLVIIRFGRDWDPDCMRQDEVLYRKSPLQISLAISSLAEWESLALVVRSKPPQAKPLATLFSGPSANILQASLIASRTSPSFTSAISIRFQTLSRCTVCINLSLIAFY